MNIHDGPTGAMIRWERNREANAPKRRRRSTGRFRLRGAPNQTVLRTMLFKEKYGIA